MIILGNGILFLFMIILNILSFGQCSPCFFINFYEFCRMMMKSRDFIIHIDSSQQPCMQCLDFLQLRINTIYTLSLTQIIFNF